VNIKHGTRNGYQRGKCRCNACLKAHTEYWKKYMSDIISGVKGEERLIRLRKQQKAQNIKPKFIAYQRKQNNERRGYLYKLKDVPCMDCGRKFPPYIMDFHHRQNTIKLFTVGTSMQRNWNAILLEASKCDIVCSNCHRARHYNEKRRAI
jgi:hypothetical protein